MIVRKLGDKVEVEGTVPARCSLSGFKVKIVLEGVRIVDGKCECGSYPCQHISKLYVRYMRYKNENKVKFG
ncbi:MULTISPECIES: SWIM zinc finger family protein [Metallosphaera]|uniref:Zinc finger SWIM domain protein n=1 Tax=Metallosphaera cuprina (strain Ar-4) TaxID=1006006 RepID=F4G3L0_METCR|nr:SWIM zinc finger family protein [Metallosphaera cuprina]AEB95380.1 zinc finger SWIM domain protein [Metallosphaera cuprina Ar-4]